MKIFQLILIAACLPAPLLLDTVPETKAQEQYKKQARDAISQIVDGKADAAIKHLEKYLKDHPLDLESCYGLALACIRKGDLEKTLVLMKQAVNAGLPFSRFQAGPRSLMQPLIADPRFKQLENEYGEELLHGPLLGCVTDHSARIWIRTAHEVPVQARFFASDDPDSPMTSPAVRTVRERDFTALLPLEGLEPDTRYSYALLVNAQETPGGPHTFRTYPSRGSVARFEVGFGGGAGYTPEHERMWQTVASRDPLAFLFLGDNVYIDNPTRPAVQQYCYYRRQSRPEYRAFCGDTPIYAIWDDHDFTTNDQWGGPEIGKPRWKIPVWRIFRDNWNNPAYGGGEKQPGCWFDFSIGDVDFIMLDGRYYRTNPKSENPSMLGPVQKAWLFDTLKASRAAFIVLASPVPWALNTKPGSLDTWKGYENEREEIFSFIKRNRISGVILLSADRHRSDVWKIERDEGYDLYEFESSRLTNIHKHRVMPGALFGYNAKCSFGLLSFDTRAADPEVTYRIINIDNEVIHTFTVKRSLLR